MALAEWRNGPVVGRAWRLGSPLVRRPAADLRNAACTCGPRCAPASLNWKPRVILPHCLPNPVMAFVSSLALDGAAALSLPPSSVVGGISAGPSFATRSVLLQKPRASRTNLLSPSHVLWPPPGDMHTAMHTVAALFEQFYNSLEWTPLGWTRASGNSEGTGDTGAVGGLAAKAND